MNMDRFVPSEEASPEDKIRTCNDLADFERALKNVSGKLLTEITIEGIQNIVSVIEKAARTSDETTLLECLISAEQLPNIFGIRQKSLTLINAKLKFFHRINITGTK
jgi:hypothetical protein